MGFTLLCKSVRTRVHGRGAHGCGQCMWRMRKGCVDVVSTCAWEDDAWVTVVSACAWEEDAWVRSQCMCMGGGRVGVVSTCAWEEDVWVWSVHVHGRRTRGCGQCVCMGAS